MNVKRIAPPILVLVGLLILWQIVTQILNIPTVLIARPTFIGTWIVTHSTTLLTNSEITVEEILVGFALGSLGGLLIGILISEFQFFSITLYPLIIMTQVIPVVAIAPILVLWFGFGVASKIAVAAIICFFPVVINSAHGFSSVEPDIINLARVNNASRLSILTKIQFPYGLPYIFDGLKLASSLSVVGAVVGEMVGSSSGLGYLITYGSFRVDTNMMFAALFVLFLFGIALFAVISALQRYASPWYYAQRQTS